MKEKGATMQLRFATRLLAGVGLVGLMMGGLANQARADFEINIFDTPGGTLLSTVIDNGLGDSNPLVGQIVVSGTDLGNLNGDVSGTGVTFTALNATSNAGAPTTAAELTVGGTITGSGSVYVATSATDYTFPPGPSYAVTSTFSGTFTNVGVGTTENFTSYFNDSNVQGATDSATGTLIFANSGTGSYSGTAPTLVVPGTPPYSLTNVAGLTVFGGTLGFNGSTTVRAIPEPGSVALLLLGGSGLFALQIRRRKTA